MNTFETITFRKTLKQIQVVVVTAALVMMGSAHGGGGNGTDMATLDHLVQTIKDQQRQLEALHEQVEHLKEMATSADHTAKQAMAAKHKKYGVTVYGSLRPSLTYSDIGDDTKTDVTDFLSRVGVKGHVAISDSLSAFYRGEWETEIEDNGDFGKARLAYVGLKGGLGQIAIGKQWDPHYNIVAEVTDIYNHSSSPFGYDEASPFRTDQLVTYSVSLGGLNLQSGFHFDGSEEPDDADAGSIGVGYRMGPLYAGVSYLEQHGADDQERSFTGLAASMDVSENLYLAITYQDIEDDNNLVNGALVDYDQSSVDLAAAMALGGGYKLKTSYFDWDGDDKGRSFDGYNLTIENQLNDKVRVFVEYLQRDIEDREDGEDEDYVSLGLRYDFEAQL